MKPPNVPCPPRNPHCHGAIDDLPIDNPFFITIIIVLITIYAGWWLSINVRLMNEVNN